MILLLKRKFHQFLFYISYDIYNTYTIYFYIFHKKFHSMMPMHY